MDATYLKTKFDAALAWSNYLATDSAKAGNWQKIYEQVQLSDEQRRLIEGFVREMKVLCVSGIWCGDCA